MRGNHSLTGGRGAATRKRIAIAGVGALLLSGLVTAAQAELVGSNFESSDGNLVVNGTAPNGGVDWANAPNRVGQNDKAPGNGDDSFGEGTKEDDLTPTVVAGSIPPNKSDLKRFYVANEKGSNGHEFLYLAWERINTLGTANMDFEINQKAQPDLTTPGQKNLSATRTSGDLLVLYDFDGGGTVPTISLVKWLDGTEGGVAGDCKASNALPCWGALPGEDDDDGLNDNSINLTAAGYADGAVNNLCPDTKKCTATTQDPIANDNLPTLTFGEAAIDLTAAGVFPEGECTNFGSAYLKSRSSTSFTAATKDFIAPASINVNNCGGLVIRKISVGDTGTFGFTSDTLPDRTAGDPDTELSLTTIAQNTAVSETYSDLLAGTYDIDEVVPAGWTLTSATCTNGTPAAINVVVGQTTTCTFTNTAKATLIVEKQTVGGDGVFDFTEGANLDDAGTFTLSDNGTASYVDIAPGTYTVTESAEDGWMFPPAISCDDANSTGSNGVATYNLEAGETVTCTFTNTKKAKVSISKTDDDDPANALNGAVFSIYLDNDPQGGSPGVEDVGTMGTPIAPVATCTTAGAGTCSTDYVLDPSKAYWVVETTTPAGYSTADPQRITPSAGQDVSLEFVDKRRFKVITIVCQNSDDSLYPSDVTLDGETKTSLGSAPAFATAAELCSLGGASFGPKHYGTYEGQVDIGQ